MKGPAPTPPPVPLAAVRLMSGTTEVANTTAGADGTFSFTGVGYGTYTIQADRIGYGTGVSTSVSVVVGGNVNLPGNNVPITNIRQLTYTFTVTPTTTRTITFSGVTGAVGQSTFVINEDAPRTYSIVAAGYLTATGTAPLPSSYQTTAVPVPVTLTANAITGTVTDFTGTALVYLCLANDNNCPTTPYRTALTVTADTDGNATFSFGAVPPGNYKIIVRKYNTNTTAVNVSINAASGAMVEAPPSITAPQPPPP